MDWKILASTFGVIFLAELGDKTQFAALAVSAQTKSTVSVLFGVVLALTLAGVLGVLAGRLLGEFVNPQIMRLLSGGAFLCMGIWILTHRAAV